MRKNMILVSHIHSILEKLHSPIPSSIVSDQFKIAEITNPLFVSLQSIDLVAP